MSSESRKSYSNLSWYNSWHPYSKFDPLGNWFFYAINPCRISSYVEDSKVKSIYTFLYEPVNFGRGSVFLIFRRSEPFLFKHTWWSSMFLNFMSCHLFWGWILIDWKITDLIYWLLVWLIVWLIEMLSRWKFVTKIFWHLKKSRVLEFQEPRDIRLVTFD